MNQIGRFADRIGWRAASSEISDDEASAVRASKRLLI
jgi:hypothetical protein